jgi:hypothetical protein
MSICKQQERSIPLLPFVALLGSMLLGVHAEASTLQIGGGACSTSMVKGTYFYLFTGAIVSGQSVAYAELGKLVADGNGNYYGNAFGSGNGQQAADSFSGTYTVQPNCTGSMTGAGTATFQVVNNGQGMILAITTSNAFATGAADRQAAGATPIQCGNGSLSGAYGYLTTGVAPGGLTYNEVGQFVADGNGNGTVASDCSGTASITNQNGTIDYRLAI